MSYYRICPDCGAALDPGEPCDCRPEPWMNRGDTMKEFQRAKRKTAFDAANIEGGVVERDLTDRFSASNDNGK